MIFGIMLFLSLILITLAVLSLQKVNSPLSSPYMFMRNKFAAIGVQLFLSLVTAMVISFLMYNLGICDGGLLSPVVCVNFPHLLGEIVYDILLFSSLCLSYIGLPALACYTIAEIMTRNRMSGENA